MLKTLKALVPKDRDLPERAWAITWRKKFLDTSIYDLMAHEFHEEKDAQGEYVPLRNRSPSVRYGLPAIITQDTTSLLFGEDHFPAVELGDDGAEKNLMRIFKDCKVRSIMAHAAETGSVGSVAILLRVLENRLYLSVMETTYLTPTWKDNAPDTLGKVVEKYKTKGRALRDLGYTIADKDLDRDFWFQRDFTESEELWYLPWPVARTEEEKKLPNYQEGQKDETRSVEHKLGFVPIEWVKNLPGGNDIDGKCTWELGLPISIEIDYLLSQGGRGLKYASDPTLHIREPAYQQMAGEPTVKGAANAIVTSEQGDVRVLEISGSASGAVLEQVNKLRELALELCSGSRASPERLSGAQSGRAMELMNQNLIWIAGKLRTSYGETALVGIIRKIAKINAKSPLKLDGDEDVPMGSIKGKGITLKWPPWYAPTASDHMSMATAIKTYRDAGVLSRSTAVRQISHDFDIEDPDQELKQIDEDREADVELELKANPAPMPQPAGA